MRARFLTFFLLAATMGSYELTGATFALSPVADTSLFEGAADNNMGGHESIAAGGNATGASFRALLKFDVADSLPPGAVIESASLQLTVIKAPGAASLSSFTIHRVLKNWGEGDKGFGVTGIGALATDGQATWNARLFPTTLWSEPGGQPGEDFASAASGTTSEQVQASGTADFASTSNLTADVRNWLTDPGNNFGWLLKSDSEESNFTARRFGSSEGTTPPLLTINAIVPPRIEFASITDGQFSLQFDGEGGKAYVVERRTQVDGGDWTVVTNISPLEASGPVTASDPIVSGSRFYRVAELPSPGLRLGN